MKFHDLEQGTEEWFAIRRGKLTASDAQAIASDGKGLETLCFKLAAEKISGKSQENYTNEDMERGKELEKMARDAYEMETGMVVKLVGFVELSEFIGCSPDGLINEDGLLELKCPNDTNFTRFMYEEKIDSKYIWQVQMQMFVTERKFADLAMFNQNFPKAIIITRIDRDEEKIAKLQEGLTSGENFIKSILQKV